MLTIGICAVASDAIELDYHLEEFVKWHAPNVNKLVLNVNTQSGDETLAVLQYLQRHYPALEVFTSDWEDPKNKRWLGDAKFAAWKRLETTCKILLDVDEFLEDPQEPRQYLEGITRERQKELLAHIWPLSYTHFVGSWKQIGKAPQWPDLQWRIGFRGLPALEQATFIDNSGSNLIGIAPAQESLWRLLHFGCVRQRGKLLEKWEAQMQRNYEQPSLATQDWATAADGQITLRASQLWEVPPFFQTPEFEREKP